MTRKGIEGYRQRLADIQNKPDAKERSNALRELAKKVGASTHGLSMFGDSDREGVAEANLVANIHNAPQTATMIDMCKTANRNFIVVLIAMVIALGSVAAAWVAVLSEYCLP